MRINILHGTRFHSSLATLSPHCHSSDVRIRAVKEGLRLHIVERCQMVSGCSERRSNIYKVVYGYEIKYLQCRNLKLIVIRHSSSSSHKATIPTPHTSAPKTIIPSSTLLTNAAFVDAAVAAALLCVPDCPDAVAVHCSPHAYPSGQQFPPRFAAHEYHALGQLPPAVVGATTTTPLVLTTVSVGSSQLPVVWQSRPTRQQPEG
jgi:hypothetical protein